MKFIAIVILAASTLCFAQTSVQRGDYQGDPGRPCNPNNPGLDEGCKITLSKPTTRAEDKAKNAALTADFQEKMKAAIAREHLSPAILNKVAKPEPPPAPAPAPAKFVRPLSAADAPPPSGPAVGPAPK